MRKASLFVCTIILLACSCLTNGAARPVELIPPTGASSSTETSMPVEPATPTATIVPSVEPAATLGAGFTIVRVVPADGNLNDQLAAEAAKAELLGQDAYVEFDATWCPSCKAIETSLEDGNDLMVDAFQGVYIVRADVDAWENDLEGTGFEFEAIPIFFAVDDQGRPTGEWIDGDAWGENIPENMAPPLKEFFQSR
jgi:thiol-disulfide isomerase/thioredoxin